MLDSNWWTFNALARNMISASLLIGSALIIVPLRLNLFVTREKKKCYLILF